MLTDCLLLCRERKWELNFQYSFLLLLVFYLSRKSVTRYFLKPFMVVKFKTMAHTVLKSLKTSMHLEVDQLSFNKIMR